MSRPFGHSFRAVFSELGGGKNDRPLLAARARYLIGAGVVSARLVGERRCHCAREAEADRGRAAVACHGGEQSSGWRSTEAATAWEAGDGQKSGGREKADGGEAESTGG